MTEAPTGPLSDWPTRLTALLAGTSPAADDADDPERDAADGGAELLVRNGTEDTFLAPLARTWRRDPDDPQILWIRPLTPAVRSTTGPVFPLSQCRPRALAFTAVTVDPAGAVRFILRSGQTAQVRAATGTALQTVQDWDTFYYTALTAEEEIELDAVAEDVWTGRFA